jgi:hypothetical protein
MTSVQIRPDRRDPAGGERALDNGRFDVLLDRCLQQEIPLAVYAQTGSAVVRAAL